MGLGSLPQDQMAQQGTTQLHQPLEFPAWKAYLMRSGLGFALRRVLPSAAHRLVYECSWLWAHCSRDGTAPDTGRPEDSTNKLHAHPEKLATGFSFSYKNKIAFF